MEFEVAYSVLPEKAKDAEIGSLFVPAQTEEAAEHTAKNWLHEQFGEHEVIYLCVFVEGEEE
jgi:hypothetical protein